MCDTNVMFSICVVNRCSCFGKTGNVDVLMFQYSSIVIVIVGSTAGVEVPWNDELIKR